MPVMSGAAIAGIAGAGLSMMGQNNANKTNEQIANSANATQIDLANTQFQRRVKDLEGAGLNPMLAYTQGGAAVPQMNVSRAESVTGQAVTSASQGALMQAMVHKEESAAQLNEAAASKAQADADAATASALEARARTPIYANQIKEINARIDNYVQDTKLKFEDTILIKRQAMLAILTGQEIESRSANFEMDTVLKKVNRDIAVNQLRMSDVSANAAESPLGRYVMPFLPFGNTTAAAVGAGRVSDVHFGKK